MLSLLEIYTHYWNKLEPILRTSVNAKDLTGDLFTDFLVYQKAFEALPTPKQFYPLSEIDKNDNINLIKLIHIKLMNLYAQQKEMDEYHDKYCSCRKK